MSTYTPHVQESAFHKQMIGILYIEETSLIALVTSLVCALVQVNRSLATHIYCTGRQGDTSHAPSENNPANIYPNVRQYTLLAN